MPELDPEFLSAATSGFGGAPAMPRTTWQQFIAPGTQPPTTTLDPSGQLRTAWVPSPQTEAANAAAAAASRFATGVATTDWGDVAKMYADSLVMGTGAPEFGNARALEYATQRWPGANIEAHQLYHGAPPHVPPFEQFSTKFIGTGEGSQMAGKGLYFAQNEALSKNAYRGPEWVTRYMLGDKELTNSELTRIARNIKLRDPAYTADQIEFGLSTYATFQLLRNERAQLLRQIDHEAAHGYPDTGARRNVQDQLTLIDHLMSQGAEARNMKGGHMYEVNVHAPDEAFINWDKPISEQSQFVKDALSKIPDLTRRAVYIGDRPFETVLNEANINESTRNFVVRHLRDSLLGGDQWTRAVADYRNWLNSSFASSTRDSLVAALDEVTSGVDPAQVRLVNELPEHWMPRDFVNGIPGGGLDAGEMAQLLRDQKIAGVKFFDRASRAAQQGTRNYVVLDDNIIEIIRRYGILGLLGGAAGVEAAGSDQ